MRGESTRSYTLDTASLPGGRFGKLHFWYLEREEYIFRAKNGIGGNFKENLKIPLRDNFRSPWVVSFFAIMGTPVEAFS